MKTEETQKEFDEMARQAEATEAACANGPADHIPPFKQEFFLVDTNINAKSVFIGAIWLAAFVIAEFAFNCL